MGGFFVSNPYLWEYKSNLNYSFICGEIPFINTFCCPFVAQIT